MNCASLWQAAVSMRERAVPWKQEYVPCGTGCRSTMVGGHLVRGHLHRGPGDHSGGDRHQLSGPTGVPGNSAPR